MSAEQKASAQLKLTEHKRMLKETGGMMEFMPRGLLRDALNETLPIFEAEAEVMQAILDAVD